MGNRHLESAERVFLPPTEEIAARPLADLQFIGLDNEGNRLYKPTTNLTNPVINGVVAEIENNSLSRILRYNYSEETTYTLPLLPETFVVNGPSDYPSEIDVETHVADIVRQNKDGLLDWITNQAPDTNLINFTLGRRWGTAPIQRVSQMLGQKGIRTYIIATGGRKRLQQYGIVLEHTIDFYKVSQPR